MNRLNRLFGISVSGSTPRREVLAGITTFASMAYILVVNPAMLAQTGMEQGALVTGTAVAAAMGCLLMALFTNYPIALAPGMGLNAFFTYSICLNNEVPWQGALAMVFWNGVFFMAISGTGLRTQIVKAIPQNLKLGMQAGIGLFIAVIGLQNSGIIVDHPVTLLTLGNLSNGWVPNAATLSLIGLVVAVVLMRKGTPGAILIAIAGVAAVGLLVPSGEEGTMLTPIPNGIVASPKSLNPVLLQIDWWYPFTHWQSAWIMVLSLLFVDMFDSIGTLVAVSNQADLVNEDGDLEKMGSALFADATATSLGACVGCSPVTSYVESATGVETGGRTGLTSIVVALCFLLALFFHPLILAVPVAATAPALILVGFLMLSGLAKMDWDDLAAVVPGLVTALLIPLSFGIANGIAIGCIAHTMIMILAGKFNRVHWLMLLLSLLFVLKFVFVRE